MVSWLMLRRRIFSRRLIVLFILTIFAILAYSHVFLYQADKPSDRLPDLKQENNSNDPNDLVITKPPSKVKVNEQTNKDSQEKDKENKEQTKIKEYVFHIFSDEKPIFTQEVAFDLMEPFQDYKVLYNNKDVGKAMVGMLDMKLPEFNSSYQRENATFFSLVRNEDFEGIIDAIESVESRFNSRFHYDWVFANDKPFHPTFKKLVSKLVSGEAKFIQIPKKFWDYPDFIDQAKAEKTRIEMESNKIKYGGSESYRHMCRFNSGLFFQLEEMKKYRYYWRVEPEIQYNCDLFETDWFKYMRENKKKYAFTLAPLELHKTVVGLWETVQEFAKKNKKLVAKDNNMNFLTEDDGRTYNMCHFWSNFEIGDMDFYRLEAYSKFFDYVDKAGGFYYSRWGDAPIHSMAVSLLLDKDELLFLQDTGYYHKPNGDCPHDPQVRKSRRCACLVASDATWKTSSCIPKWFEVHDIPKPEFAPQYKFVNQHVPEEEKPEEDAHEENDEE